jgi:FtsH-binding integral membrane protein
MFSNTYTNNSTKSFDAGLRQYFLAVYNYIAIALAITGVSAFAALNFAPLTKLLYVVGPYGQFMGTTGVGTLMSFAPIGFALYFFMGFANMDLRKAQTVFWIYAAVMGLSLSYLGIVYTGVSLARTFFVCAASFGAMSIYGYSTNKDLTSMGSFLITGLIGIVVASLINIFLQSSAIYFATSLIGIVIFLGLIAWDTQKLKVIYYQAGGGELGQKMAILGALNLYMDLINLFLHMLRFLGDRRN